MFRFLLCWLLLSFAGAQRIVRVKYGYFAESRPIHTACARGWLDYSDGATEYRVTCYPQTSGGYAVSKLDSGQLDLALLGSTPMAQAAARGIPLSVIYISHYMGESQGIYVRASDDSYEEIAHPFELVDRKIAVPFGSTMHYQVLFLIDLFGLSGQVEVIDMSPSEIIRAWSNKEIDGAGCWGEARDFLLKNNGDGHPNLFPAKTLMSAGVLADWGRPTFVVLAAQRTFAEENPGFVTNFLAVLSRINDSFLDKLGEIDSGNVARWNAQGVAGESYVPSMVDVLMKAGETHGRPSQQFMNLQRRSLDLFIQQTAEEQLSCDYLGNCDAPSLQIISLRETAEFLQSQKVVESLGILDLLWDSSQCQNESTLCGSKILDPSWLRDAQRSCSNCYRVGPYLGQFASSSNLLSRLEQLDSASSRSPYAVFEIGRISGATAPSGNSICSGHRQLFASNNPTIGDGANALAGNSYSDNLECTWEIRAPGCPMGMVGCDGQVILNWDRIRVWSGDFVRVYTDAQFDCKLDSENKILLAQYSNFFEEGELPPVVASGCLLVEFNTDGNQERSYGDVANLGDGFQARATSSTEGHICDPSREDCNCIRDGSPAWGVDCAFTDFCIGTSFVDLDYFDEYATLANSGQFDSLSVFGGSDLQYPNDLDCTFEIHSSSPYIEVEVYYDLETSYDLLVLQTGAPRYGTDAPYVVLTGANDPSMKERYFIPVDQNGVASAHLTTDARGRRKGFFARVRSSWGDPPSRCSDGYSGIACEISHCTAANKVALPSRKRQPFDLGRVISQPSHLRVPAMPWAPTGGCTWPLNLAGSNAWGKAVAIRLNFISLLDLEPYPDRNVGDSLIIRTKDGETKLFAEKCTSNENCGMPWQTGTCRLEEPRRCGVKRTVEVRAPTTSFAEAILTTDRNDGGVVYRGLDFEAVLVEQCPKKNKDCEEVDDAKCVDGFCICKDDVPCDCPCGAKVKKFNVAVAVGVIAPLFLLLIGVFLWYRRKKIIQSRQQKAVIEAKEAELDAFRNSVVGMRIAITEYVPVTSGSPEKPKSKASRLPIPLAPPKAFWCWKETSHLMSNHTSEDIWGDPADCWIKYNQGTSDKMEAAFVEQGQQGMYSPLRGYMVDFGRLVQTKTATGFERDITRIIVEDVNNKDMETKEVDLDTAQFGESLPEEISSEPQMVLVVGDIVQISTQRNDGWAFGTKLTHADEAVARQLVHVATEGISDEDANIFTDTGWFALSATDIPSGDALAQLQDKVGDTDVLAPPSTWVDITDPTVVELHKLSKGDDEREAVVKAFMSTLHGPHTKFSKKVTIDSVSRIQNLAMWQSYIVKLQTMCYRDTGLHNGSDTGEDPKVVQQRAMQRFGRRWLWHGTNIEVMDKIMQQGFNRSFCGKNATVYGKGVYHARDASYSAYPLYSVPDSKGFQYIMANRVAVGEFCRGIQNGLTPDVRDAATQALYDSTVDSITDPSIYVTYHDAQAYPEYLIKFKTSA